MVERLKRLWVFVFISFVGFLLGIAANFFYFVALPILIEVFPQILGMTWVIWGIIGAFLSVAGCLIYAFDMSKRLKILGLFAVIGFLVGVAGNLLCFNVLPILIILFPQLFKVTWITWGLIGAFISVAGCIIYAYFPQR